MYKVIKLFLDGQDYLHKYEVGDIYPREGYNPSQERLEGLLGTGNKQGVPLIEEIPEPKEEPEVEEVTEEVEEPEVEKKTKRSKTKKKK